MPDDLLTRVRQSPNPYDFANPVSDEKKFFGRTTETGDVIYYLNYAKQTDRPIHLAFVGARASGKTSFLNMTELEAKRREFCTVRINLNEGDVESDLQFFRKVLHSILTAAYSLGGFGGKSSRSYLSYVELIATGQAADNEDVPFISAFFISKGLHSGNKNSTVPDDMFADDLNLIAREVDRPIIVLFDECNVLSASRIILEKLRNIFMNLTGYMLVFAATGEFFPTMDEVFSPIMRQFKRIDIGPFKEEQNVAECIKQPLRQLGFSEREIRSLVSDPFVKEVDTLTSRRPYEVQLICHSLFRSCQEGTVKRFGLDLRTLEYIQRELASGKNVAERPAIKASQQLNRRMLDALDAISASDQRMSIEDWWRLEYLFYGSTRWTHSAFLSAAQHIASVGPMHLDENGLLYFSGDEFDRIYIRYFARSKQSFVRLWSATVESLFFATFLRVFSGFDALVPVIGISSTDYFDDVDAIVSFVEGGDEKAVGENMPLLEELVSSCLRFPEGKALKLFEVHYISEMGSGQFWFIWAEPEHLAGVKKVGKRLGELIDRASEVGFTVSTKTWDFVVPMTNELVDRVQLQGDEQLNTRMSNVLMEMVREYYVQRKDKEGAKRMAESAFALSESRLHGEANNVGYLYMDASDFEEASLWFKAARQYGTESLDNLLQYNIGVLAAITGDIPAARAELAQVTDKDVENIACVSRLSFDGGEIKREEVEYPKSLVALADEAISVLEQMEIGKAVLH